MHQSIVVTVSGSFQNYEVTNCIVDDVVVKPRRSTPTEATCPIPLNTKTQRQDGIVYSSISVSSDGIRSPISRWIRRYDVSSMAIDITDFSGGTPAAGLYNGGVKAGPIRVHGNAAILNLVNESHTVKGEALNVALQCRFKHDVDSLKPAQRWSAKPGFFASCSTPPSYMTQSTVGEAGEVVVEFSVDGQAWITSTNNYTFLCNKAEYYIPNPTMGECTKCAPGAVCDGTELVMPQDGYYAVKSPTKFDLCINPTACQSRNISQDCTEPHAGLLCAGCDTGYGVNNDFECVQCSNTSVTIMAFVAFLLLALLISGGLVAKTICESEKDDDSYKSGKNKPFFILLTAIGMLQTAAFFQDFDYKWPDFISGLFSASQTASGGGLGFLNIACVGQILFPGLSHAYAEAIIVSLLPPFCLAIFVAVLFMLHYMGYRGNIVRRLTICMFHVIFLFQPLAVGGILKALACHNVGGSSYLYHDNSVECWTGSYAVWFVSLLLCFFFYAAFLPGFNLFTLFRDRDRILAEDEEVLRDWGFEISPFESDYFYWNLVIMARKVALKAVITLSRPYGIVVQSQLAIFISVVALIFHVRCMPYREDILDWVELLGIMAFAITAWLGVLMSQEEVDGNSKMATSVAIAAVNVAIFLHMFWHFVIESKHYVQEKLQAHHQSAEQEVELSAMASNIVIPMSDLSHSSTLHVPKKANVGAKSENKYKTAALSSTTGPVNQEADPSQLTYMELKKWLAHAGCPTSELDAAMDKAELLLLLPRYYQPSGGAGLT